MDKFLLMDKPVEQRKQILSDSCDAIEEIGYMKHFTPEQLLQKKDQLADVSIVIDKVENEKKDAMNAFKEKLKPLNEDKKTLLVDINNKARHVTERCYKMIDYDSRMVGYYTEEGELVHARPIQPQEMQKTIPGEARTRVLNGTND